MKQTREINHGDGHIDIETLFGDVWAVTKCNLEVTMPQYTVSYYHRNPSDPQASLEIQRESITAQNAQEAREIFEDNDMEIIEVVETSKLVDTLYTKIDELNATIANLNEGAKIMHAFATGGESKLLADWQIEAEAQAADARDKKTDFNTPEIKEAEEVADNFNFDEIKPIKF